MMTLEPKAGAARVGDGNRPGAATVHLQKFCVGAERVEDLEDWQRRLMQRRRAEGLDPRPVHVTRSSPKRAAEVLNGGSLYWVFKGLILARQRIEALEPDEGPDGVTRCRIVLDPAIHRTRAVARRPFQGWRYLEAKDAPADIAAGDPLADLPEELRRALSEVGVT